MVRMDEFIATEPLKRKSLLQFQKHIFVFQKCKDVMFLMYIYLQFSIIQASNLTASNLFETSKEPALLLIPVRLYTLPTAESTTLTEAEEEI